MKKVLYLLLILSLLVIPCEAKTPWSSKPPVGSQIDWSHPLSCGLVGAWLLNEGNGLVGYDLLKKHNCLLRSVVAQPQRWGISSKGMGTLHSSPLGTINTIGTGLLGENNSFTIVGLFYPQSVTNPMLVTKGSDGTSWGWLDSNGWSIQLNLTTNTMFPYFSIVTTSGGAAARTAQGTTAQVINKPCMLVGSWQKGKEVRVYVNGKLGAITATTADTLRNPTTNMQFGVYGSVFLTGYINFVYIYSRVLSPSEIQQLYIDPYCFIKPTTDWDMIKAAVVGGVRRIFLIQ